MTWENREGSGRRVSEGARGGLLAPRVSMDLVMDTQPPTVSSDEGSGMRVQKRGAGRAALNRAPRTHGAWLSSLVPPPISPNPLA